MQLVPQEQTLAHDTYVIRRLEGAWQLCLNGELIASFALEAQAVYAAYAAALRSIDVGREVQVVLQEDGETTILTNPEMDRAERGQN